MKLTYSKPVAEIEEFALVDVLTESVVGAENINDDFAGSSEDLGDDF